MLLIACSTISAMEQNAIKKRLRNSDTLEPDTTKKICIQDSISHISKDEFAKRLEYLKKQCLKLDASRAERDILLIAFTSEFPQEQFTIASDVITPEELEIIEKDIIDAEHNSHLPITNNAVCAYAKFAAKIERALARCYAEISAIKSFTQLFQEHDKKKDVSPLLSYFT